MSAFAFLSFGFVDPFMTSDALTPLFITRGMAIFIGLSLFGLCYTKYGLPHATKIGAFITYTTGNGRYKQGANPIVLRHG